ncbi:beta-phosphoglucomutase [Alkalispirochaeta sphaeroplastigenens]|uniref:Beta-phosphoglucomutase n=1 Tax=Alkalispirochaeta sphaeroplastigenens TaxID=1187066 RepID=A0A2S4JM15_9SPIO|nr:beta-phosphoglucomutase [Alkalispirochaeta sphaeroplastigenens]
MAKDVTTKIPIEAVIFDLDGVVVYTDEYHSRGWKRLCDDQGWRFPEEVSDQLRGVSRMESLQIILDSNGVSATEEEKEEMAHRKNEYYKTYLQEVDEGALVPGAVDFIGELRRRGVLIGLGSASKNALTVLRGLGIEALFDQAVTGLDITRSKPDPQVFTLGGQRLGVAPERCVVFEDAVSGVEAANAAGMISVGFGPTQGLDQAGANLLVPDYASLDVEAFLAGTLFS